MSRTCRIWEKSWKPRFHELEHESKVRLLKTHSHTSERKGNKAGKVRRKVEKKENLALRNWNKSSAKAIAMPPATGVGRESVYGEAKSEHKKRGGPVSQ